MVKSFVIFTFKIPEMKVQFQPQFSPHCFVYWTPGQQGALPQVMAGNNKNIITHWQDEVEVTVMLVGIRLYLPVSVFI